MPSDCSNLPDENVPRDSASNGPGKNVVSKDIAIIVLAGLCLMVGVISLWWKARRAEFAPIASETPAPAAVETAKSDDRPSDASVTYDFLKSATALDVEQIDVFPQSIDAVTTEAIQAMTRLVQAFPKDADALEVRARVARALGDFDTAADCWTQCLKLNPQYAYAHRGLAKLAVKQAHYETAVEHQRAALQLAPDFLDAAVELSDTLLKLGRTDEAIDAVKELSQRHPDVIALSACLGRAYLQKRDYANAKDAFENVLRLDPDVPSALVGLTTALTRLDRRNEAAAVMERLKAARAKEAAELDQRNEKYDDLTATCIDIASNYTLAARVYLSHGQPANAEQLLTRVVTLNAKSEDARMQLAAIYQKTGRDDDALRMCEELSAIAPENPAYYLNLGTMYGNLNRFDDAEMAFQAMLRLRPDDPEGCASLARLYLRQNHQIDQAVQLAYKAAEAAPTKAHFLLLHEACLKNGDQAGASQALQRANALQRRGSSIDSDGTPRK